MIMIAIIIMHILILMIIVMIIPVPASRPAKLAKVRKGTSVVSNDGVTANKHVFFDRGTFWVLPLSYFYTPRSARARLFPQPDNKNITFAAAPFVLTPFVRNQMHPCRRIRTRTPVTRSLGGPFAILLPTLVKRVSFGVNQVSDTTSLTRVFFKRGESRSTSW